MPAMMCYMEICLLNDDNAKLQLNQHDIYEVATRSLEKK